MTASMRRKLRMYLIYVVLAFLVSLSLSWAVRGALRPITYRGWIREVDRQASWIEVETTEELQDGWEEHVRIIQFVPSNYNALDRLKPGDYVQIVFLGAVEANSVQLIAELGSPTELVASALYGDPQFLSIGSTSLRLLRDYEISYENRADCSACGAHYCPASKTSLTVHNSSGEVGSCTLEPGQRCMISHNGNRISATFHSGEVICQPVLGPQAVSDFTIDLEVRLTSPFQTEHFEIHFDDGAAADWGDDRRLDCAGSINHECTLVDGSNGWPDFVEAVGLAMEVVRHVELGTYGFGPDHEPVSGFIPPVIRHDKYQVRIVEDLEDDENAEMQPEIGFVEPTSHIGFKRSWIEDLAKDFPQLVGVCAEEFMHAIQHAMVGNGVFELLRTKELWSLEGSATWIAHELLLEEFGQGYKVYDDQVRDYLVHTYGPLKIPNAEVEHPPQGEYGRALYWRFLCDNLKEQFGNPGNEHHASLLRKIFENLAGMEESPCPATAISQAVIEGLDKEFCEDFDELCGRFDELYMRFVRANYFATEWYPSPSLPGDLFIKTIDLSSVETQSFTPDAGQEVGRYACYYIKVTSPADCPVSVSFDGYGNRYFFERFLGGNQTSAIGVKDFFHPLPGDSANGTLYIIGRLDDVGDGTFSMTFSRGEEPEPEATSSTMLVIDTSESMNWDDLSGVSKIQAARTAAAGFINMVERENETFDLNHQAGLVTFNGSAALPSPLTNDLPELRTQIAALTATDGTNMYDALTLANGQLSSTLSEPIILLLSDGVPTVGPAGGAGYEVHEQDVLLGPVSDAAASGYCIYAVGFGKPGEVVQGDPSIDPNFLDAIVQATGCAAGYHPAEQASELLFAFVDMRQESMERDEVGRKRGAVQQGQTMDLGAITVPPRQKALYANLTWPGSQLDLILVDPRGREVDANYPGTAIGVYENMVYEIIEEPLSGTWKASVFGRDIPSGSTKFAFLASVEPAEEEPEKPAPQESELGMLGIRSSGPIDLILKDPQGRIVSKEFPAVDGIEYIERFDASADATVDEITIPNRMVGDYQIRVIVEPQAERLDRFGLVATDGFDTVTLANRKFIIHVPNEPYVIRCTEEGFFNATRLPEEPVPEEKPTHDAGISMLTIVLIAVGSVALIGGILGLLYFLRSRYYI